MMHHEIKQPGLYRGFNCSMQYFNLYVNRLGIEKWHIAFEENIQLQI